MALDTEAVPLGEACGRVLAEDIAADRDYPAADRSIRDGFAVRAGDTPGELNVIGEIRAGQPASVEVTPGTAVEVMTGAPIPPGADAVIMVEHVVRKDGRIRYDRKAEAGQFVNPAGAEMTARQMVLHAGTRLDYAGVALAAMVGRPMLQVHRRVEVAIIATGDEIVAVHEQPLPHQIRNSNAHSLAAQVMRAGGIPRILPVARDTIASTRDCLEQALACDLTLLSGGVSAGKYDVVEQVLAEAGAEFFFDRVLIQPGQPLVFGRCRGRFFFGLPGNPASTMVTFEIFARAALELLSGQREIQLPLLAARLTEPFQHKNGLTRFLPAILSDDGSSLTPIRWQGSSDVGAMARANCLLVADPDQERWEAGDWMKVMRK
jgi:molybdopterin molybdotransferase